MKRYKAEQKRWEWDTETKSDKKVKRAVEGSERQRAKKEIRKELLVGDQQDMEYDGLKHDRVHEEKRVYRKGKK